MLRIHRRNQYEQLASTANALAHAYAATQSKAGHRAFSKFMDQLNQADETQPATNLKDFAQAAALLGIPQA